VIGTPAIRIASERESAEPGRRMQPGRRRHREQWWARRL